MSSSECIRLSCRGCITRVCVGGACSVSHAAITATKNILEDTTVMVDGKVNDNAVAGIHSNFQSIEVTIANSTLTVENSADSNVLCFYGVAGIAGNIIDISQSGAAQLNIELEAADGQDAILFYSDGKIKVRSSVNAMVEGGSSGNVIGAEALDGVITFSGTETFLNVISKGGNAFGVYNDQTSSIGFYSQNTSIKVQNSTDSTGVTKGVMAYQSQTSFTGDSTNISVQGGSGDTFGIHLISDTGGSDTQVSFSGGTTVIGVAGTETTYGVAASGSSGSVSFAGESATVKVSSSEGTAGGIVSQDGAHITASAAMDIEVKTPSGDAYGIILASYGNADFADDLTVSASSSTGDAYGIMNAATGTAEGLEDNGRLFVSGTALISASSRDGDAYGLYSDGEYAESTLSGDTSIAVSSTNGKSFGIVADNGAKIFFGVEGTTSSITATGTGSTAVYLAEGSSIAFSGTNTLSANMTALADDGTGVITNSGLLSVIQGTVSGFTGSYVQTAGVTLLEESSGFFGSDVTLEKGALAVNMADMGGLTVEENQALLALGSPVTIAEGKTLTVGTVDASTSAEVAFGADSVLVVDGLVASESAMLTSASGGSISVADGAQLYIANAQSGTAYFITKGLSITEGDYWETANLLTGRLIEATVSIYEGNLVVSAEALDAGKTLPGVIPVNALNAMMEGKLNDINSSSMGIRFLSRAMDETFITPDTLAVATVNEVSRAAVTAGVQNTSLRLAEASADQLMQHLSLSFFDKDSSFHYGGIDMWATPLYGNTYTHGMTESGTSVRGNYGGLALGADTEVGDFLGGRVRTGLAFHVGGGQSKSHGMAASTKNSYNFGGIGLYTGWNFDELNIMASMSYSMAGHDVKMSLPDSMCMNSAEADVDTRTFIADLRAEYQTSIDVADILLHAGVRYVSLHTKSYDVLVGGSLLNRAASDTQRIIQFPVGVGFAKNIEVNGWTVKPQADVSVIPTAGDKRNTTKVSYAGISAEDSLSTRIMDSTSVSGMLGIHAEKDNFVFGLNYGVQASRHETDQRVNVVGIWKF